jgi:hypothetical protein
MLKVGCTSRGSVIVYAGGGTYVEELTPAPTFRPTAVLVVDGMLLVGDAGGRALARWNIEQRIWLEPWTPPGMIAPVGLAADADGNFLIADAVAGQVFRVTSDGRRLTPLGRAGRGPGEFVRPKQVCATQSGLILVVDAGRQSLIVFSHDGTYVTEIHERVDGWRGWTLPMGVITLDPSLLPELDRPDTCVLVSDSLGAPSLTVLGVLEGSSPKTADVR